jgi:hypothetical protein
MSLKMVKDYGIIIGGGLQYCCQVELTIVQVDVARLKGKMLEHAMPKCMCFDIRLS